MTLVRRVDDRSIATLTLDSPANRNALSSQLVAELLTHMSAAGADSGVRAIVLTHTGSVFCSGADLRERAGERDDQTRTARLLDLLQIVVRTPKPVVARVDGAARAGGLGLVGACDIAIASAASTFAFTEVRLGLAPAIISLTTGSRMSERAAARYYLTGETFDAAEAARCGLLTAATQDAATLDATVASLCDALRACSPQGLASAKALTVRALVRSFDQDAGELTQLSDRLFSSDEGREGMRAFLERRPPRWVAEHPTTR